MNKPNPVLTSPAMVKTLIHYQCAMTELENKDSAAAIEITSYLLSVGAIEPETLSISQSPYRTTPLGKAWLKTICQTPIPQVAYIDVHGKVIEHE